MNYISTRDEKNEVSASFAIVEGIAKDGGLYVPKSLPKIGVEDLAKAGWKDYASVAAKVMSEFLEHYSYEQLLEITKKVYGQNFENRSVAPNIELNSSQSVLELFHGPTSAFKDFALQMLPYLMTDAAKEIGKKEKIMILVATSGDTGKAALEGFKNVENTCVCVFYPKDGVSDIQKVQMETQEGDNVDVCSVIGNFDDTQSEVKEIFADEAVAGELKAKGYSLSSANSINWGRLLPQIVYYYWSYINLFHNQAINVGDKVNFVVPTGNFGNILAGYYAKQMGLPINKLICASNENNVLTDFFNDGVYDKNRDFYKTISPSMDILVSSNLERLLFELSEKKGDRVAKLSGELKMAGKYKITKAMQDKLADDFYAGFSQEEQTLETIRKIFYKYEYLMDPHTAVGQSVYEKYVEQTQDKTYTVLLSTASPYKFSRDVLKAFNKEVPENEFESLYQLFELCKQDIPAKIKALKDKQIRFDEVVEKDKMKEHVLNFAR